MDGFVPTLAAMDSGGRSGGGYAAGEALEEGGGGQMAECAKEGAGSVGVVCSTAGVLIQKCG